MSQNYQIYPSPSLCRNTAPKKSGYSSSSLIPTVHPVTSVTKVEPVEIVTPVSTVAPLSTKSTKSNMFVLLFLPTFVLFYFLYDTFENNTISRFIIALGFILLALFIFFLSIPPPETPTNIIVSGGNAQASVAFIGQAGCTFTVTSSCRVKVKGTSSPILVTGLNNGTSYIFTVTASNIFGTSASSAPSNAVTPSVGTSIPAAPTNIIATRGNASASVAFTASANATSYTVTSSPSGITATGSASPITVSGLTNGTAYTFTVRATNGSGSSQASASSNVVTPVAPTPPPGTLITLDTEINLLGKRIFITNNTGQSVENFNILFSCGFRPDEEPCNILPSGWAVSAQYGAYLPLGETSQTLVNGASVSFIMPISFSSLCINGNFQSLFSIYLYIDSTLSFSVNVNQSESGTFTFNGVSDGSANTTWFDGYALSYSNP